ncbi:MAG TPA: DUF2269 family protein [Polyangiales bacterium]|nr:DUF2269 family protein [Polyangiales bacterium]
MALYRIYVYLHVLGAFGAFAALAVEALALGLLCRAADAEQQRQALALLRADRVLGPLSTLVLLGSGLYLAFAVWSPAPPWVAASFAAFLAIVMLGAAVTGRLVAKLERSLQGAETHRQPLATGALRSSFGARLGLMLGIAFAMVVKPQLVGCLAALGTGLALGLLGARSIPAAEGGRQSSDKQTTGA